MKIIGKTKTIEVEELSWDVGMPEQGVGKLKFKVPHNPEIYGVLWEGELTLEIQEPYSGDTIVFPGFRYLTYVGDLSTLEVEGHYHE